jgi:hypothetical protein
MATVDPKDVVPHCSFCGGKGKAGERIEKVKDRMGHVYHVPPTHRTCKESVRSLSFDLLVMK